MEIVKTTIGFRGPSGALDLDAVTLATGEAGSGVTYEGGVLTLPRGDKGEQGTSTGVRSFTDLAAAEAAAAQYPGDIITFKPPGA